MFSVDIIKQLFHEESLSAVPLEKLEQLSADYPYFTQAQLLLAEKKAELDQIREPEWQKLQLYISNPFLLQQLKNNKQEITEVQETIADNNSASINGIDTAGTFSEELLAEESDSAQDIEDEIIAEVAPEENEYDETEATASTDLLEEDEAPEEEIEISDEDEETEIAELPTEKLIQPLFTRDYFAHQGIKLPEEIDDSKPPTSAQLRSFTDWLRTTKRPKGAIDPDEAASPAGMQTDEAEPEVPASVKRMADSSNLQGKVVTEAMADILVKQGHIEKATEIYEKLSLQNPEKSSYFAQKIKDIKASN